MEFFWRGNRYHVEVFQRLIFTGHLLLVQRPLPSAEQRGYKGQTNGTLET